MGRRGEREGRSLCVTNFPPLVNSSHISDLLPRCAPQLSFPIIKIILRVIIVIIVVESYLRTFSYLLPWSREAGFKFHFVAFSVHNSSNFVHFTLCCQIQDIVAFSIFLSNLLFVSLNNISVTAFPRPSLTYLRLLVKPLQITNLICLKLQNVFVSTFKIYLFSE